MIEVEKKFYLSGDQQKGLIDNATFVSKKEIIDVYYDTDDCALTRKLWWLRYRNGALELKTVRKISAAEDVDFFDEFVEENVIRAKLGLTAGGSIEEAFSRAGYAELVTITSTRTTFREGAFRIDIDEADCGGHPLTLVEIELLVEKPEEMEAAAQSIVAFARQKNLRTDVSVRGKGYEYLYHERPDVYAAIETLKKEL